MFAPLSETDRQTHFAQNSRCFIPGYTGHCPTLRFHFGTCYGAKTKEILRDLNDRGVIRNIQSKPYRSSDPGTLVLKPVEKSKGQTRDYYLNTQYRCPRYIIGYTGFIPTLNFRYGKSYSRTADDSMCDFDERQRSARECRRDEERLSRSRSTPKTKALRSEDEVARTLRDYEESNKFRAREITPDFPPIAGYTGHIPRVKGNEESLSQRYNTVVKRGLTLMKQDRDNRNAAKKTQKKIKEIVERAEGPSY